MLEDEGMMEQLQATECQHTVWPPPPLTTPKVRSTGEGKKRSGPLADLGYVLGHTFNCVVILRIVPPASEGTAAAVSHYLAWTIFPALALGGWVMIFWRIALWIRDRIRGKV